MSYFHTSNRLAGNFNYGQEQVSGIHLEQAHDKLLSLHRALAERTRHCDWDLHPHHNKASLISQSSAASSAAQSDVLTLSYFRSASQAHLVENLMHIDTANCPDSGEPYRHPVIELRVGADCFAIELILSPYASWDQQNFIGKLELPRHRTALRRLIGSMDGNYRFGFWEGTELSEMHLTTWEMGHGRVLDEWMNTFAEGQDWLRFGMWYPLESEELASQHIVNEAQGRIADLYTLYEFMLWTSNNNFHDFYEKREKALRRTFA